MSKFRRSVHFVGLGDPIPSSGWFYAETGSYGVKGPYQARHYWFMFFRLFGIRYSIEWGSLPPGPRL